MRIEITSDTTELFAETIISDGTRYCEDGHTIRKGMIGFIDPSDIILCKRHMIAQLAALINE